MTGDKADASGNRYRRGLQKAFKQFRLGLSLFFTGLVIIYCVSQLLAPSLQQELVAALGLLLIAVGFTLSVVAEVRIVLNRLLTYFFDNQVQENGRDIPRSG